MVHRRDDVSTFNRSSAFQGKTEYLTMQEVLKGKYIALRRAFLRTQRISSINSSSEVQRNDSGTRTSARSGVTHSSPRLEIGLLSGREARGFSLHGVGSDATVSESETDGDSDTDDDWKARVSAAEAWLSGALVYAHCAKMKVGSLRASPRLGVCILARKNRKRARQSVRSARRTNPRNRSPSSLIIYERVGIPHDAFARCHV